MKKLFTLGLGIILMCALSTVALAADISTSVTVADGGTMMISENSTLNADATLTIDAGGTLIIAENVEFTIAAGATLTNNGTIVNSNGGTIIVNDGINLATALNADLNGKVHLGSTITLTENWTPIGTEEAPFTGTFYGRRQYIQGMSIASDSNYQGLFGYISGADIDSVVVCGALINNSTEYVSASVTGGDYVGGIVGYAVNSTICRCTFGDFSYLTDTLTGDNNVGGILGGGSGTTISSCTNYATITGDDNVGQIVGNSTGITLGTDADANTENGSAAIKYEGGPLVLTEGVGTVGEGFTWDETDLVLTITGLTIDTTDDDGITLPAGSTIVLNGNLTIESEDDGGIVFKGENSSNSEITINNGATLSISCDGNGISTVDDGSGYLANLIIDNDGTLTIDSNGDGIDLDGTCTYSGRGTMDIIADGDACIYANADVTLGGTVTMSNSEYGGSGIYADGDPETIKITIIGNVTINVAGEEGACIAANDNLKNLNIENNGTLTLNTTGSAYEGIDAYATALSITGTGTLTSEGVIGCADTSTISGDVNALVQYMDSGYNCDTTVYGAVTLTQTLVDGWYEGDAITFNSGATLTIPAGVALDLNEVDLGDGYIQSAGSIDIENGALVVDGLLMFPSGATVDFEAISGDGYVMIGAAAYTTDETEVKAVSGDITLTTTQVTAEENLGYTWIADNGVYTLTFTGETIVTGDITLQVTDAIIAGSEKLTVAGGIYMNVMNDALTINGDLTVGNLYTYSLAIGADATVVATAGALAFGQVTINGEFTSTMLMAVDVLTIKDGATVTLTGMSLVNMGHSDASIALALVSSSAVGGSNEEEPTLALGDNIALLTPSGGAVKTTLVADWPSPGDSFYFTSIATGDGGFTQGDWSNMAGTVTFGEKPVSTSSAPSSYSSSVSSASNGDVSISSSKSSSGTTITITATPDDGYVVGDVTVAYASGREVSVTDNGDGTYSYLQPGAAVTVTVTFVSEDGEEEILVDEASGFYDVDSDAYYYEAMLWAVENGITTGYADDTFRATTSATRAQVVTFLWRAAGSPVVTADAAAAALVDADPDSYYYQAMVWAVENGITAGYADGTFRANDTCTRSQIVTFLYRYLG